MFNIYDTESGELLTICDNEPIVFDTGRIAADYCKAYSHEGRKLQPRKAAQGDDNWRGREQSRIATGQYKRPSYLADLERDPEHFLHLAEKRPGQLAYTKDAAKGAQDAQSIITLQGYIETYYQDISRTERARIVAEHEGRSLEEDGLKFASTPDEIAEVYTNYDRYCRSVAGSCMRHEADNYLGNIPHHPTYVYGAGDLAVAYTINEEGRTTARALCWPDRLVYSRVYADDGGRLHDMLKQRGYVKSCVYYGGKDHERSLLGARLLRIEHPDRSRAFLVPYCDETDEATDDGKFLKLVSCGGRVSLHVYTGDHARAWSDGIDDDEEENSSDYTCDRCEEGCDETYTVYTSRTREQSWCEHCESYHSFLCEYSDDRYSNNVASVEVNGQQWSTYAFQDHGGECARSGDNYLLDALVAVVVDEYGTTELWGTEAREAHTWTCDKSYALVSDDVECMIVTLPQMGEQDWAPHVAARHGRGQALVPWRPRLTLKGDDPGQLSFSPGIIYLPYQQAA